MNNITPLIMCKNEESSIMYTLYTIHMFPKMCVYDTGSTDATLDIIKNFCEMNNIELRYFRGEFEDFSKSRNKLFDYAEGFSDVDWMLLLDSNDELSNGKELLEYPLGNDKDAYFVPQCHEYKGTQNKFVNIRLIRARCGYYYKAPVHEYITNRNMEIKALPKLPEQFELYQFRDRDLHKSSARFKRDLEILSVPYTDDENEEMRRLYYSGQTNVCLARDYPENVKYKEDAYDCFLQLTKMNDERFKEEKFSACMSCGQLAQELGHSWGVTLNHYMEAFGADTRVEPLLRIILHYIEKREWFSAYMFSAFSLRLERPAATITCSNPAEYDYFRYYLNALVFLELGKKSVEFFNAGFEAIELAKEGAIKHKIDLSELVELYDTYQKLKPLVDDQTITVKEISEEQYLANKKRCEEKKEYKENDDNE